MCEGAISLLRSEEIIKESPASINISLLRSAVVRQAHFTSSLARISVFHLHDLGLPRAIDRHDKKIVVFGFRNNGILRPSKGCDNFRHGVVVTGDEDRLPGMLRAHLRQKVR